MIVKNDIFWIIFIIAIKCVTSQYEDCEQPPHTEHATVEIVPGSQDDDEIRAIYTCDEGYKLVGEPELFCDLDSDEWQGKPPICEKANGSDETTNRRKKGRGQTILEETGIQDEYAQQLDLTCMTHDEQITAPEIENAYIVKYNRRMKAGKVFLVAFYECEEDFELEDSNRNRLYCSKQKWIGSTPICLGTKNDEEDYGDEDGYDENEAGATGDEENESDRESYNEYDEHEQTENEEDGTHQKHTTRKPDTNLSCSSNNGGCDHECRMVRDDNEDQPRIVCSCYSGFNLDPLNRRTCHDIDECQENNGGCQQTCNNKPGSYECSCHPGLQIDTISGKNCVDINECLLRNGHGPCQDTCINNFGGYNCTCDGLPGTRIREDGHSCEDAGECANNNGGCSHNCLTNMGRVYCLCPNGFILGDDWQTCKDIDECQHPEIKAECVHGCENTLGSYRCVEPHHETTTTITITPHRQPPASEADPYDADAEETEHDDDDDEDDDENPESNEIDHHPAPTVTAHGGIEPCSDGFKRNDHGDCEDIDECLTGNTGCEHCQNAYGGYECVCPSGYELNEDEKTCADINECEFYADYESDGSQEAAQATSSSICSHECINTQGSYLCKCPDTYHLHDDQRSCVPDYCRDLEDPNLNKLKCSHECVDENEGFRCKCPDGVSLGHDNKTCHGHVVHQLETVTTNVDHCHGHEKCHPGICVSSHSNYECECPSGFISIGHACEDVNECTTNDHGCSHDCHNRHGSFECGCRHGYRLDGNDRRSCHDINECHEDPNICGELQCINRDGGHDCVEHSLCGDDNGGCSHDCHTVRGRTECSCPEGAELMEDHKTCIRANPCGSNNGGCSHYCDSNHEPICQCRHGYKLDGDERTCIDVDECVQDNGRCEHECINREGGYECSCRSGFHVAADNHTCVDVNECDNENGRCHHYCRNEHGSYVCECYTGYKLDSNQHTCIDVDECAVGNGNCSDICNNFDGGYQCSCHEGQVLVDDERTCDYVNECEINNGGCSHDCHYVQGRVTCLCPPGYKLDNEDVKSCVDINECEENNGGCSHHCRNLHGHYHCECPHGLELQSNNKTCNDIDECSYDNGNCNHICVNLIGGHLCTCEVGYELQADNHTCVDIDECVDDFNDCSHHCINVPGAYECSCPPGFVLGRDHFTCEDINECETIDRNGGCSDACINTLGSFYCTCPDGHVLTVDNRTCSDVDECSDENRRCSHDCINTIGAFRCLCPTGLELSDDLVTCSDIDECADGRNAGCSDICENFEGSYRCRCPRGFKLDADQKTCTDLNECDVDNGGCEQICINHRGGYECGCSGGYALKADNHSCEDSDPCVFKNGGCDQLCNVREGIAICSCHSGYKWDIESHKCIDVNECDGDHKCPHKCYNTQGSYSCECHSGFRRNEKGECEDIDECKVGNGGCSHNAKCYNLIGSSRCVCPNGSKLSNDRRTCLEIKDLCKLIKAPLHGDMRCTRSRHRTQLFYRTKCAIWCKKGYKLQGSSLRHCNGTGHWDEGDSLCVPQSCPRLLRPAHGTILPASCVNGKIFAGERCNLHCPSGYKPAGKRTIICGANQSWEPSNELTCLPVEQAEPIKPFIRCPADATITLSKNQKLVYVQLQQPTTNVDWHKYVDTHPAWGKSLEAQLPVGVHVITFRARSPNSHLNDICRTIITVKSQQPPDVIYCPESFDVELEQHETSRAVQWKEPEFKSNAPLKQIYKSKMPGTRFAAGVHYISYVATDADGLTSKCNFRINVKATYAESRKLYVGPQQTSAAVTHHRFNNHESYLICPGQNAIKLETNYPLQVPPGCHIKNYRIPQYRKYHNPASNNVLRHYSTWDKHPNSGYYNSPRAWRKK